MGTIIKSINRPATGNLDKRVKRHVIGSRQVFFAVCPPGFEALVQQELQRLCPALEFGAPDKGGVTFRGRLGDLYLANLRMHTTGRILMRLATFKAPGFNVLEKQTRSIAWSLFLPAGTVPRCHVTTRHCRLYHTQAVADRVRKSIAAHWQELGILPADSQDQRLFVRLVDDTATISLDSSGANLYRRGLKTQKARAPLRETLAALVLRIARYDPGAALVDPMCGAGTFSLEAALMAKKIAPGLHRDFAFMQWPAFRRRQWEYIKRNAAAEIKQVRQPVIWASDTDEKACAGLSSCVGQNGLTDAVTVAKKDFFSLHSADFSPRPGLVVLNPPYGRRLAAAGGTTDFYGRIAAKLRRDFRGWKAAVLAPGQQAANALDLPFKACRLDHGGLKLTLLTGRLP